MQHYRERRELTRQHVTVTRGEDAWSASVVNATAEGMRLRTEAPLMLDDRIAIDGGSWSLGATVVWMKDGATGVRLDKPMNDLLLTRVTGKAKRLNRKSRVGFGHSRI